MQRVDRLFDILNSKSLLAKGFKGPLTPDNLSGIRNFLLETREYLLELRLLNDGPTLVSTRRYLLKR